MTSPMARLQQKKQAAVTTGSAGSTGIPCAMVYGLYRALPGDLRLVATVVRRTDPATLAPASERQDHTTLPSASRLTRLVNRRVHRIPLPTSVTIAIRPSGGGGTGEKMLVICPTPQARFAATDWHDGQFAHGGHARYACRAKSVRPSRRSFMESSPLVETRHTPRMRGIQYAVLSRFNR